ncbi:ImmA/IrrE family metallo-endopeptidase [Dorea sp. OM07-5]|uniref:ImmA/IrrE family metallo-endopeptidase n=1 Tax=Dorea sp. OM07-5 TaxID=2293100 RepID=UPI000E4DB85E|nr:ImmA/IrrE family metallo-endopeptidase [Dorea sp. OM07-5]RHU97171.1 ImmA/IrrE family metallo-endopeptidase [Dorea sp. OM07-5]
MNTYEKLQDEACEDGIDVIDYTFHSDRIKGLYSKGTVAIRKDMNTTEKACVLAEELGHYYTTVGNILDMNVPANRKQERQARLHGYNRLIGLIGLADAYEHGCQNRYEIAEYLEITEEYLEDCIECYRGKYGICTAVDNYIIYFIPHLAVIELI